jgi:peptide deformylase
MTLLNILQFPDPRLKRKATLVDTFDQEIFKLVNNMLETMYEAQGVGLAAIQVNVTKRIIVIDISETRNQPLCLINPEITDKKETIEWDEGCLSFPGVYAKVKRSKEIEVTFYDALGKIHKLSTGGLLAICIQHELDHLNGITFYDHLSGLKQNMLRKKLDKLRRKAL